MKYIPLVQVCDFQGGSQPPKDQWIDHEKNGYIRMLQIRDFTQPDKDNVEFVRISKTIKTCNEDDILIGRYGASVGKILTGLAGAYNVAIIKTIPDTSRLSKRFLYHYLNSPYFQNFILSVGSRAAQAGFNKDDLSDAQIPDVSLEEQSNIVFQLDKVSELIALRKAQLAKLDQLVKSRFIELFGDPVTNEKNWPRLTLGDICEIGSSKRVFEKDYVPQGVPFFRTKEIVELSKGNSISTELFITKEHFAELKSAYGAPKKDDLLISAVGTIGTIWIVSGDFEFYFKDGNLIQIKASPNFNSIFMKYLLDELIANYKKEMSTGTAYSALTIVGLKKMLVYDVPLTLQEQFAAFVEQIDKSKLAIQQSLEKLELLKKSLMQEYFG